MVCLVALTEMHTQVYRGRDWAVAGLNPVHNRKAFGKIVGFCRYEGNTVQAEGIEGEIEPGTAKVRWDTPAAADENILYQIGKNAFFTLTRCRYDEVTTPTSPQKASC